MIKIMKKVSKMFKGRLHCNFEIRMYLQAHYGVSPLQRIKYYFDRIYLKINYHRI